MPSLSIRRSHLLEALDNKFTDEEVEEKLFNFGVEIDDIYEEEGIKMYKLDIAANRYDLLCMEGLARALRPFMLGEKYTDISVKTASLTVYKESTHERSAIACAVIRGIKFTPELYDSFISFQDKLHSSIGRNRSLVAIGTHDLSKFKGGEITYKSINLADHDFRPLNYSSSEAIRGDQLRSYFEGDKKISKFFSLMSDESKAVAFMEGDTIISIPPIINSDNTKISLETEDVFVEVTGTDMAKVNSALKLILANFRGESVEGVIIRDSEDMLTPTINRRKFRISLATVEKKLRIQISLEQLKVLLERMMHLVEVEDGAVVVYCPEVRQDVLHSCDILEDIAIAYGFANFKATTPCFSTIGRENPLEKFSDKIRREFAILGFNEALTLTLLSKAENTTDHEKQVVLANPKSKEYEVVRTSLFPGIMKCVASNLHGRIPIKFFEVADVVLLCPKEPEGAKNERRFCGCIASNTAMLEELQGPLSLIFEKVGIRNYKYEHFIDLKYLENQAALIKIGNKVLGSIGVVHPKECLAFKVPYAVSFFELNFSELFQEFIRINKAS